jgi:putative membrane protein
MRSRIPIIASILFAVVVLVLAVNNQLSLYIHPRYLTFTVTMALFGLLMLILSRQTYPLTTSWGFVILLGCMALFIPAQSLSQNIAGDRIQTQIASQNVATSSYERFSTDLRRFDVRDWAVYLNTNPPDSAVLNKELMVEGFILRNNGNTYLARYQLTCCAVDASPHTLKIMETPEIASIPEGDWLRIVGRMYINGGEFIAIIDEYERIEEPEQPYVY